MRGFIKVLKNKLKWLKESDYERCDWVYKYIEERKGVRVKRGERRKGISFPRGIEENFTPEELTSKNISYNKVLFAFEYAVEEAENIDGIYLYIDNMNAAWRQYKLREKRKKQNLKKSCYFFLNKSVINHINKYADREGVDKNKAIELLLVSSIKDRAIPKNEVIIETEQLKKYKDIQEQNEDLNSELDSLKIMLDQKNAELDSYKEKLEAVKIEHNTFIELQKEKKDLITKYNDLLMTNIQYMVRLQDAGIYDDKLTQSQKNVVNQKYEERKLNAPSSSPVQDSI